MVNKDRILELLAKKKFNSATLSEIAELTALLKEAEISEKDFRNIFPILDLTFYSDQNTSKDFVEKKWETLKRDHFIDTEVTSLSHNSKAKQRSLSQKIILLSGVAAAVFVMTAFFIFYNFQPGLHKNIITTKFGSKTKIQMSDGTLIWLNVGSKITYDDYYGIKNRTVYLTGEAYFDVHHNNKMPFIIMTKKLTVKDLGTVFNVKAYPEDNVYEASLISGSLEVSFPQRPKERFVLKPNEKILLNRNIDPKDTISINNTLISLTKVSYIPKENLIEEIAWVDNQLVFKDQSFKELSLQMQRWYDVKIIIEDSHLLQKRFTGIYKNETVFEALDALKQTCHFQYAFDKKTNIITIKPN